MSSTLNTASAMNTYAITDGGTGLTFKSRCALMILVEGNQRLFNQYGVMLVNPTKHSHVKREFGLAFVAWNISTEGQNTIVTYKIGGEQLFFPNAQ